MSVSTVADTKGIEKSIEKYYFMFNGFHVGKCCYNFSPTVACIEPSNIMKGK